MDYPVSPCTMLPLFVGEEERSADRAAKEDGRVPDPRNEGRLLLCRTRYLRTESDRKPHELRVDRIGRLRKVLSGNVLDTVGMYPAARGLDEDRRPGRAIYAFAADQKLYAGCATALAIGVKQFVDARNARDGSANTLYLPDVIEFCHHSTFVAGAEVLCAGELAANREGYLTYVSNWSGHYRPSKEHLLHFVAFLAERGVGLAGVTCGVVSADESVQCYPAAAWLAARGDDVEPVAEVPAHASAASLFSALAD
jgi:hypothetical protein